MLEIKRTINDGIYRKVSLTSTVISEFTNLDCASAESQNLGMVLLLNGHLPQDTIGSVMVGFVSATESKSDKATTKVLINKDRMTKIVGIHAKLHFTQDNTIHFYGEYRLLIQKRV